MKKIQLFKMSDFFLDMMKILSKILMLQPPFKWSLFLLYIIKKRQILDEFVEYFKSTNKFDDFRCAIEFLK